MSAEVEQGTSSPRVNRRQILRLTIGLLLAGFGFWLATRNLDPAAVWQALRQARPGPILLATAVIIATLFAKAWRWQLLFYPPQTAPPFPQVARTLFTGQFLNLFLPIARLGDISRIFLLDKQVSKAQILGTLVLEKTLDLIMLTLTLLLLLPFLALPETITQPAVLVGLAAAVFLALYLLAYQTPHIVTLVRKLSRFLPSPLQDKVINVIAAGLEGLATLRHTTTAVQILTISAVIGLLGVLTPFILFSALNIDANFVHAALLNVVVSVGSVPVSVPGHIGIFEALVVFTLTPFTTADPAVVFSYALLYHLVVVVPMIFLGGLSTAGSGFRLPVLWGKKPA